MTSGPRGYTQGKGQVTVTRVRCLEACGHWGGASQTVCPGGVGFDLGPAMTGSLRRTPSPEWLWVGTGHVASETARSRESPCSPRGKLVPHPSTGSLSPLTDPTLDAPATSWWGAFYGPSAPKTRGRIHSPIGHRCYVDAGKSCSPARTLEPQPVPRCALLTPQDARHPCCFPLCVHGFAYADMHECVCAHMYVGGMTL